MAEDSTPIEQKVLQAQEEAEYLTKISKDFKRLQKQKARKTGGAEARMLTARAYDWGEQYVSQTARGLKVEPSEDNKLYLVFNLISQAKEKLVGRLTALGGSYYARPDKKGPQAQSEAEVVDKLILALDEKLEQPTRMWELVDNLLAMGVAFVYTPWIPNATSEPVAQFDENNELLFRVVDSEEVVPESIKDMLVQQGTPPEQFEVYEEVEQVGDVGCEILCPLNVFVDQSVKSTDDLAPDQAIYFAKVRTIGWIEDNYPGKVDEEKLDDDIKIVTTSFFQEGDATASMFLKDLIPTVQGEVAPDDPKMAIVVERFQPVSKKFPHGRFTCFIPNKYVLYDGENPYEEIPIIDFHLRPTTTTFWTKDFITDLIPPQKFLNKRLSQLGEQSNAAIYDKILLGGTLSSKDIIPDKPQVVEKAINEQGVALAQRLPGPQLPAWFPDSIKTVITLLQQMAGGANLFGESKFPGQLRGSMAVPFLQEILDTEWGPIYQHIGAKMARVHQQRINRVKQFYPAVRTLHYTDSDQRDEVLVFHTSTILRGGTNFNITVEKGSLLPEFRALREDRIMSRLQSPLGVLYTDDRTGQLDKSAIAAELKMGSFGREGKQAKSRKFAQQLIKKLWTGQPVPPVLQFWDHEPMLDELEAEMMTTEWLSASPQVQELFINRWKEHAFFLQQRAEMQNRAMMSQSIQTAVAQATQQAAAMAAADTVNSTQQQMGAQQQAEQENPIAPQLRARQEFPGG